MTHPRPPANAEPYVRALGPEVAVTFFLHFGGAELYIPANPKGGSDLAVVLGIEAARALADLARDTHLPRRVPIPKPWLARYHHSKGLPKAEIARILHASDVSVRRWIAGADERPFPDPAQMTLF